VQTPPGRQRRALVAVGAVRYSVSVAYVGQTVSVHEGIGHYEFFHQDQLIALTRMPSGTAW